MNNYIVIDVETGGLDPKEHSLLEVACIFMRGDEELGRWHSYIKSDTFRVTPTALKVNGLDLNEVHEYGYEARFAAIDFLDAVQYYYGKDKPTIMGFNVGFDLGFIYEQFLTKEALHKVTNYKSLDVFAVGQFLTESLGLNPPTMRLSGFMELLGLGNEESEGRHTAMFDAEMTWKVYKGFLELVRDMDSRANQ